MGKRRELYLYEEILLLALQDKKGTVAADDMAFAYALGASILAELLLIGRVSVSGSGKKKLVDLISSTPLGDPILDECLKKLRDAKRRGSLSTWVSRFAGIKKLSHRAAQQLCRRGILRMDEASVLLLFRRKIYPELDPGPEKEVIHRLRQAIFTESEEVDPRTAALVALADKAGVFKNVFDKQELKARKERIGKIGEGELTTEAVREVVEAVQAAVLLSAVMVSATS